MSGVGGGRRHPVDRRDDVAHVEDAVGRGPGKVPAMTAPTGVAGTA